jgi:hypothetical protein
MFPATIRRQGASQWRECRLFPPDFQTSTAAVGNTACGKSGSGRLYALLPQVASVFLSSLDKLMWET